MTALSGEMCLTNFHFIYTKSLSTGPDDFTALQMTLTFGPGNTRREVAVSISNDTIVEPDQYFTSRLRLGTAEPGVRLEPNLTTIVILDDDSKDND